MSQAEFFHVRCGRCCLGKGTRLSPQTAMRGLRASRAAAALALAVMAACLAPCGVGASGFDAAAQGKERAGDAQAPRAHRAPADVLVPLRARARRRQAHDHGRGFEDTAGLAVRFAASRGAPDGGPLLHTTRARFVSRTKIECVAPRIALGDPSRARLREQRRRRVVRAAARARPLGRNINIKQRVASGVRRGHTRCPGRRRGRVPPIRRRSAERASGGSPFPNEAQTKGAR